MRKGWIGLMVALGLAGGPASAEVLPVSGIYPANADAAAPVRQLVLSRFGGRDGEAVSFAIEDALRSVAINGTAWFDVYADAGPGDATLRGFANLESTTAKVTRKQDVCLEKDDDGNCARKGKEDVECLQQTYYLVPEARLTARDGRTLYALDYNRDTVITVTCPKDKEPPRRRGDIVRELARKVAKAVRRDLAPTQRSDEVRVLEKRTGLSSADGDRFKQALRLSKSDSAGACRTWREIAAANPAHPASLFNAALCSEFEGRDQAARDQYLGLLRLANVAEAKDRLSQIDARARAGRQLAAHAAR